jgi:ribonuclease Z
MKGTWRVTDIHPEEMLTSRYELTDAFAIAHDEAKQPRSKFLIETTDYTVEAHAMNHRTPTIAYVVREKTRQNIDMNSVAKLGLRPGPWMKTVKDPAKGTESIAINGVSHSVASLREALVVEKPGDSIAYLTDFLLDEESLERLSAVLKGCKTVVCEGQYRHCDLDLAKKNFHMTTVLTAQLAHRANIEALILFHLSDRYKQEEWHHMLLEARTHFPATSYPASWKIGSV